LGGKEPKRAGEGRAKGPGRGSGRGSRKAPEGRADRGKSGELGTPSPFRRLEICKFIVFSELLEVLITSKKPIRVRRRAWGGLAGARLALGGWQGRGGRLKFMAGWDVWMRRPFSWILPGLVRVRAPGGADGVFQLAGTLTALAAGLDGGRPALNVCGNSGNARVWFRGHFGSGVGGAGRRDWR
jgi:hypothetical protein